MPFLSPLQGSIVGFSPGLTPWAAFLRRFAAVHGACVAQTVLHQSSRCRLLLHLAQSLILGKQIQAALDRCQALGNISARELADCQALVKESVVGRDGYAFLQRIDARRQISRARQQAVEQQIVVGLKLSPDRSPGWRTRSPYSGLHRSTLSGRWPRARTDLCCSPSPADPGERNSSPCIPDATE